MARDRAEEVAPTASEELSTDEAVRWLREVEGELFRTPPNKTGRQAWVAVVRVPAPLAKKKPTIIGLGATFEEAASVAAAQWRALHADATLH